MLRQAERERERLKNQCGAVWSECGVVWSGVEQVWSGVERVWSECGTRWNAVECSGMQRNASAIVLEIVLLQYCDIATIRKFGVIKFVNRRLKDEHFVERGVIEVVSERKSVCVCVRRRTEGRA